MFIRWVAPLLLMTAFIAAGCAPTEPPSTATTVQEPEPATTQAAQAASAVDPANIPLLDESGWAKFLADQRGKVVFLDCWATWCGTCKELFPHTVELHRKLAERGLVVVAVAFDDADDGARQAIAKFLGEQGADFPAFINAHGADDAAYAMLGVENSVLPHYQVYDRQGQVVKKFFFGDPTSHSATPEEVEAAVLAALASQGTAP